MAEQTLRSSQLATLRAIQLGPDGAGAMEVAERLGISVDAAEKRIERLAAQELVADHQIRWPFCTSGWITLATLTEAGREALGTPAAPEGAGE